MDDQAGAYGQGQNLPSSGLTGDLGGSLEEQLARAQERLSFYESFDSLIQENIGRSGELLRQAMDMRESAIQEIALARQQTAQAMADAEHRVVAERQQQRAALGALRDELNQLQLHAGGLVGRVSDALTEIETRGAAADVMISDATPAATPDAAPDMMPAPAADTPFDAATLDAETVAAAEQATGTAPTFDTEAGAATSLPEPDVSEPVAAKAEPAQPLDWPREPAGATGFLGGPALIDEPSEAPAELAAEAAPVPTTTLDPSVPRPIMVLVHGVPRAAAALSLQRHLAGLGHVDAVEAREYAEGVLRLQVVSRGPLQLDDIRRWEGGGNLEPVHVLEDVIEIKLPGATSF